MRLLLLVILRDGDITARRVRAEIGREDVIAIGEIEGEGVGVGWGVRRSGGGGGGVEGSGRR